MNIPEHPSEPPTQPSIQPEEPAPQTAPDSLGGLGLTEEEIQGLTESTDPALQALLGLC